MKEILILVVVYLSYVLIWFVINLIGYYLSILFKKRISDALVGLASIAVMIINTILSIGLFVYIISLLFSGKILLFILFIFIGYYVVTSLFGLLQIPLIFIPSYFAEKLESIDFNEEIVTAEILNEENKVIGVLEGDTAVRRKMAKYFLLLYFSLLGFMLVFPTEREGALFGDFIVRPFLQIITSTFIFGIIYSIYHKVKFHKFFSQDKRHYFASVWRIGFYFNIAFGFILLLIATLTNSF